MLNKLYIALKIYYIWPKGREKGVLVQRRWVFTFLCWTKSHYFFNIILQKILKYIFADFIYRFMGQMSISEIKEVKDRIYKISTILMVLLCLLFGMYFLIISDYFANYTKPLLVITGGLMIAVVIGIILLPRLPSTFEDILWFYFKLMDSLEEGDIDKSKDNINNLALNVSLFTEELETSNLFHPIQSSMKEFWYILKHVYVGLLAEKIERDNYDALNIIYGFISGSDSQKLKDSIRGVHIVDSGDLSKILFPYEEPNKIRKLITGFKNTMKYEYRNNYYVRTLFTIGFLCIVTSVFYELTEGLFGAILVAGAYIAKEGR